MTVPWHHELPRVAVHGEGRILLGVSVMERGTAQGRIKASVAGPGAVPKCGSLTRLSPAISLTPTAF